MSLKSFQLALAEIISSPLTGRAYRENPGLLEQKYTLTPREQNRLLSMLAQKGMRANYMLYQTNRMTPLSMFMPYTLKLVRARAIALAQEFWAAHPRTAFQFMDEVALFSAFLKKKVQAGLLSAPCLEDIICLEDAINHIRFRNNAAPAEGSRYSLHPLVRVVQVTADPEQLTAAMAAFDPAGPPPDVPDAKGHYLLKYDKRLWFHAIGPSLAAALSLAQPVTAVPAELVRLGFFLPVSPSVPTGA